MTTASPRPPLSSRGTTTLKALCSQLLLSIVSSQVGKERLAITQAIVKVRQSFPVFTHGKLDVNGIAYGSTHFVFMRQYGSQVLPPPPRGTPHGRLRFDGLGQ